MCSWRPEKKRKLKRPAVHMRQHDTDEFAPKCGAQWDKQYLVTYDWRYVTCKICSKMKTGMSSLEH